MTTRCSRAALLPVFAALAGCATRPEPARILPELVLDIADPVIAAEVAGVSLRLRVDLDRRDAIELNPAAAARLALAFEAGDGALVGRTPLAERSAVAPVAVGGVSVPLTLSTFDRDCCAGADGAVGPDLLPYDRVRFVRGGAAGGEERRVPLVRDGGHGLAAKVRTPAGELLVQFSLGYPGTLATAAAGAILARGYGGRIDGDSFHVTPAFGIARPARTIALARPADLLGFRIDRIAARVADFRGDHALPTPSGAAGDIVVDRRAARAQAAWPSVLLGRGRLDACAEIRFSRAPMMLTMRCTFDAPAR